MFKLNRNNESGRSMVEMLGVLAIIGVLSIGGIAGYTTAMKSYKANEIANAVSMLYVTGKATNEGAGTGSISYDSLGGWPEGATLTYNAGVITVNFAEADICKKVKSMFGDKATDCPNASPFTITVTLGDVIDTVDGTSCVGAGYDDNIKCINGIAYYCDYEKWHNTGDTCTEESEESEESGIVEGQPCFGYACTSSGAKIGCTGSEHTVDCAKETETTEACYFDCIDDGNGGYVANSW